MKAKSCMVEMECVFPLSVAVDATGLLQVIGQQLPISTPIPLGQSLIQHILLSDMEGKLRALLSMADLLEAMEIHGERPGVYDSARLLWCEKAVMLSDNNGHSHRIAVSHLETLGMVLFEGITAKEPSGGDIGWYLPAIRESLGSVPILLGRLLAGLLYPSPEHRFNSGEKGTETWAMVRSGLSDALTQQLGYQAAAGSTVGLRRHGNEDAFVLIQAHENRLDRDGHGFAIILADGMGGSKAGEVASTMAIRSVRERILSRSPWSSLAIGTLLPGEPDAVPNSLKRMETQERKIMEQQLHDDLVAAGDRIFQAAEGAQDGMGCTLEAILCLGSQCLYGHVGDSRIYLFRLGVLSQVTTDHTLVSKLVEMGVIHPREASTHPRRHEIYQAIGAGNLLEAQTGWLDLQPGDWLLVMSDGVSGAVDDFEISSAINRCGGAPRVLVQELLALANAWGGDDNATVIVVYAETCFNSALKSIG